MTPEQLAALQAGEGVAYVEDPTTGRLYVLIDQGKQPGLSEEYFRERVREGMAEADRGECRPWDLELAKRDLRQRHVAKPN